MNIFTVKNGFKFGLGFALASVLVHGVNLGLGEFYGPNIKSLTDKIRKA